MCRKTMRRALSIISELFHFFLFSDSSFFKPWGEKKEGVSRREGTALRVSLSGFLRGGGRMVFRAQDCCTTGTAADSRLRLSWYFSVVDVVGALTEQQTQRGASTYWAVLKKRLIEEGNELLTNCKQLKMTAADGKQRLTDVANTGQFSRLLQPVPVHPF